MPPRFHAPGCSGLTITELLVALAILSSSIIPIALFVSVGSETVRGTRDAAGAVFVANRTFEELRTAPYDLLSVEAQRLSTAPEIEVGSIKYRRLVTVTPLSNKGSLRAQLAWVKIEWARDRKKMLAYEVGTILSDVR